MRKSTTEALVTLLDQESDALRKGDFAGLADFAKRKNSLITALTKDQARATDIAAIRAKAARNEALFASAIKGVQTARDRISALNDVRNGLSFYSENGQMKHVPENRSAMERKA